MSFANNQAFCGRPMEPCTSITYTDETNKITPFWTGFAVGWPVAAFLVFALALNYLPQSFINKAVGFKLKSTKKKKVKPRAARGSQILPATDHMISDLGVGEIKALEKYATRISLEYLQTATNNFSRDNVIMLGKQATLYRAPLMNGNSLAVKRFQDLPHLTHHFVNEIRAAGKLRHKNILTLLGFCIERKERLLVYSDMANGSVYDWLHPIPMEAKKCTLEWPLRLGIAIGTAKGLACLHHHGKSGITHGEICSRSIFLDKHFSPRISDLGAATISESNYWDGVAFKHKIVAHSHNRKRDVFAFGMLLLELVTGKKPDYLKKLSRDFNGNLVEWIAMLLSSTHGFYAGVDEPLLGQGFDAQILEFLKLASNCISPCSSERPTILQVCSHLTNIGAGKAMISEEDQIEGVSTHHVYNNHVEAEIEIVEEMD